MSFGFRPDLAQSANTSSTENGMEEQLGQNPSRAGLEELQKKSHGIGEFWITAEDKL